MSDFYTEQRLKINQQGSAIYLLLNGNASGPMGVRMLFSTETNEVRLIGTASITNRKKILSVGKNIQKLFFAYPIEGDKKGVTIEWGTDIVTKYNVGPHDPNGQVQNLPKPPRIWPQVFDGLIFHGVDIFYV